MDQRCAACRRLGGGDAAGLGDDHIGCVHPKIDPVGERQGSDSAACGIACVQLALHLGVASGKDGQRHVCGNLTEQRVDQARRVAAADAAGHNEDVPCARVDAERRACLGFGHWHREACRDRQPGHIKPLGRHARMDAVGFDFAVREEPGVKIGLVPERNACVIGQHAVGRNMQRACTAHPGHCLHREEVRGDDVRVAARFDESAELFRMRGVGIVDRGLDAGGIVQLARTVDRAEKPRRVCDD